MSLTEFRETFESQRRSCVIVFVNNHDPSTVEECFDHLHDHIKLSNVDYYLVLEAAMYETINKIGTVEKRDDKEYFVVKGVPTIRIITQNPPLFATRAVYWSILALVPNFKEYSYGVLMNSKIALMYDIDDSAYDTTTVVQSATKVPVPSRSSVCAKGIAENITEIDLYNSSFWAGDIVTLVTNAEKLIEEDCRNNVLLSNTDYYFSNCVKDPTTVIVEDKEFLNILKLSVNENKSTIDGLYNEMSEYDKKHPEIQLDGKNPSDERYYVFAEQHLPCYEYPSSTKLAMIIPKNERIVTILSKSAKRLVYFDGSPFEEIKVNDVDAVKEPEFVKPHMQETAADTTTDTADTTANTTNTADTTADTTNTADTTADTTDTTNTTNTTTNTANTTADTTNTADTTADTMTLEFISSSSKKRTRTSKKTTTDAATTDTTTTTKQKRRTMRKRQ